MTYYEITYIEDGKACHVCVLAFSIVEAIESINKDVLGIAGDTFTTIITGASILKIAAYKDIATGKWLVERNGLEAIDSSLVKAVAILLRMEAES